MAISERRKGERITFERGVTASIMALDGSWRRDCTIEDMSESGARLGVSGSLEGLSLKEFFLLLSSTGLAYRRCEIAWQTNDQIGVAFRIPNMKKKAGRRNGHAAMDA